MDLQHIYTFVGSKGEEFKSSLSDIFSQSQKTLLFFYPKDNTPGCTVENKDFSCMISEYQKYGIKLMGVSKDSIDSHKKFIQDQDLGVGLISDTDLKLHKELSAYGEKNNYGKIVIGVIRSSFLFDTNGVMLQSWKNVRAKGHAAKVLREIER